MKVFLKNLLLICLLMVSVAIIFFMLLFFKFKSDFFAGQSFNKYNIPYSVVFLDRDNKEIYRSFKNQNREWINLNEVSDYFIKLTLLTEDRRFFSHFGVDFCGIFRAMLANINAGKIVQGGSTLTQQIAKKAFLTDERTILRKIKESFIALGIESSMTKHDILEMYVNIAPYGATLSGVKSSAKFYFDKIPQDLSLSESLVLTMLPQNPVKLSREKEIKKWLGECAEKTDIFCSPFNDKKYIKTRIENILFEYADENNLSKEEVIKTWFELYEMRLPERKNWTQGGFYHFRFYVEKFLAKEGINLTDYPGGLIVKTSIDKDLQIESLSLIEDDLKNLRENFSASNVAILAVDNKTRAPLIWIGSHDYWDNENNGQVDMLRSRRQGGSTIKPFIYLAMFEKGFSPQTIMWDTRVRFSGENKIIKNSDGHYMGAIPVKTALATSRNVPAAQALYIAGGEKKIKNYLDRSFGFNINKNYPNHPFGWTISLGTVPVKLMDLANGYATLGTGKYKEICPILEMKTTTGKKLRDICNKNTKSFVKSDARFFVNDILSNEKLRPMGIWRKNLTIKESDFAAKTGTSTTRVRSEVYPIDNFVVGYNPSLTVLSWAGNTNGRPLRQGSFGTTSIAPTWNKITSRIINKYPEMKEKFSPPLNLVKNGEEWVRKNQDLNKYKIPLMSFVSKEEDRATLQRISN